MPVHDWGKVEDGVFHAFHHFWLTTITTALNAGVLPKGYYALPDQVVGPGHPDVVGLQRGSPSDRGPAASAVGSATALLARPAVRHEDASDHKRRHGRRKRVAVRHVTGDRVVAL